MAGQTELGEVASKWCTLLGVVEKEPTREARGDKVGRRLHSSKALLSEGVERICVFLLCPQRPTLFLLASLVGSFSTTPNSVHYFDATSTSSVCRAKRKKKVVYIIRSR